MLPLLCCLIQCSVFFNIVNFHIGVNFFQSTPRRVTLFALILCFVSKLKLAVFVAASLGWLRRYIINAKQKRNPLLSVVGFTYSDVNCVHETNRQLNSYLFRNALEKTRFEQFNTPIKAQAFIWVISLTDQPYFYAFWTSKPSTFFRIVLSYATTIKIFPEATTITLHPVNESWRSCTVLYSA